MQLPSSRNLINLFDDVLSLQKHRTKRICQNIQSMYLPLAEAVTQAQNRKQDKQLAKKVYDYLEGDIPTHFQRPEPILYLSRFVATPNFELFYAVERALKHNITLVVSEDHRSKFVAANALKLSLANLAVATTESSGTYETYKTFKTVDLGVYHGKTFAELRTKTNEDFVEFHHTLLRKCHLDNVEVVDETDWVDRNSREDIYQHYKKAFALVCAHGIMLEAYTEAEHSFAQKIACPTFFEVARELGVQPLVVEHVTPEQEQERNWEAYPHSLYPFISEKFSNV